MVGEEVHFNISVSKFVFNILSQKHFKSYVSDLLNISSEQMFKFLRVRSVSFRINSGEASTLSDVNVQTPAEKNISDFL